MQNKSNDRDRRQTKKVKIKYEYIENTLVVQLNGLKEKKYTDELYFKKARNVSQNRMNIWVIMIHNST